ncbi:MAG: CheY-P-specific phosphatase CheC [Clostridia bacterium]|nr:CheY-P-specific phosphatase CheC [Clostridia bacterium]
MNGNPKNLNGIWEDVFKEIANIGSGNAATALSSLLDRTIIQSVPEIVFVPLSDVPGIMGGAEKVVMAGLLAISGDIEGYLLMILDLDQAGKIISMVTGEPEGTNGEKSLRRFSVLDKSVISEIVNIIGSSYLSAVCEFTNLVAVPSVPYLCVDMTGAVMNIAIAEIGKTGDYAILFRSELYNDNERIDGNLLLIPDENSCRKIMTSLGLSDGTE